MADNFSFLSEPPATSDTLIELLIAVVWEVCNVRTVLPVHPKPTDLWFGDEDFELLLHEADEPFFLFLVRHSSSYLYSSRDKLLQKITLVIEMAPDHPRFIRFGRYDLCDLGTSSFQ
jgi:hypothetical protein